MATGDPETTGDPEATSNLEAPSDAGARVGSGASRRRALAAVAGGLSAGIAGCTGFSQSLGDDSEREGDADGAASAAGDDGDDESGRTQEDDPGSDPAVPTPPPADDVAIDRTTDVVYRTTDERRLQLDVVRPADDVVRPLLVHVHGGGWRNGARGYEHAERMARVGLAVASVEYRLSGVAKFPAAVRDVVAAIQWLRAEAASFGIDPERVALLGESAGGHLASLVAHAPQTPAFQPESFGPEEAVAVDAIVSISGIYDLTLEGICSAPVTVDFLGGSCEERPETATEASPVTYVEAGDPPVLLFHGTEDQVIDYEQATTYRDALADAGVAVDLHTADGGGHLLQDRAEAFLPRQEAFLARHLDLAER